MGRRGPEPEEHGLKLFNALRELEIAFLNGGSSVNVGLTDLLKKHECAYAKQMVKYLFANSIVCKDPDRDRKRDSWIFYNGPRLSTQYCNDLYLQMKIAEASNVKFTPVPTLKQVWLKARDEAEAEYQLHLQKAEELKVIVKYLNNKVNEQN